MRIPYVLCVIFNVKQAPVLFGSHNVIFMKELEWGWQPPQFELLGGDVVRVFYFAEPFTEHQEREDPRSGESSSETVIRWRCEVSEVEDKVLYRMLLQTPGSVESQRRLLLERIAAYDKSAHVDSFTVSGVKLWLDSYLRDKVRENLEYCSRKGLKETTLRIGGLSFPMSVEDGWEMYYAVIGYARECWNVTETHRQAALSMDDVEDLRGYDYTKGYPSKLEF